MQITKFLLALAIVSAGVQLVFSQPLTPAEQQKALDILHQKLAEERAKDAMQSSKAATASAQPKAESSMPAASAESSDQQPHARTLWDGIKRLFGKSPSAAPSPEHEQSEAASKSADAAHGMAAPSRPTPAKSPAEPMPAKTEASAPKPSAAPEQANDSNAQPPARTLWDGMQRLFGKNSSAPAKQEHHHAEAPAKAAAKSSPTATPTPMAMPQPVAVPASPKTKDQRLSELLDSYRADQIGPVEYHEQRAKILAEP